MVRCFSMISLVCIVLPEASIGLQGGGRQHLRGLHRCLAPPSAKQELQKSPTWQDKLMLCRALSQEKRLRGLTPRPTELAGHDPQHSGSGVAR